MPSVRAIPSPPRPCGSLNLSSPLTQHCFPQDGELFTLSLVFAHSYPPFVLRFLRLAQVDSESAHMVANGALFHVVSGSHHFVCCEAIASADNDRSPHGNTNPLADVIAAASRPDNPSWCTCSEEVRAAVVCSCSLVQQQCTIFSDVCWLYECLLHCEVQCYSRCQSCHCACSTRHRSVAIQNSTSITSLQSSRRAVLE